MLIPHHQLFSSVNNQSIPTNPTPNRRQRKPATIIAILKTTKRVLYKVKFHHIEGQYFNYKQTEIWASIRHSQVSSQNKPAPKTPLPTADLSITPPAILSNNDYLSSHVGRTGRIQPTTNANSRSKKATTIFKVISTTTDTSSNTTTFNCQTIYHPARFFKLNADQLKRCEEELAHRPSSPNEIFNSAPRHFRANFLNNGTNIHTPPTEPPTTQAQIETNEATATTWLNSLSNITPAKLFGPGMVTTVLKLPTLANAAYRKASTYIAEMMISPIPSIRDNGRLLYIIFPAMIFGPIKAYHRTAPTIKSRLDKFNHFHWQQLFQDITRRQVRDNPTPPNHHDASQNDTIRRQIAKAKGNGDFSRVIKLVKTGGSPPAHPNDTLISIKAKSPQAGDKTFPNRPESTTRPPLSPAHIPPTVKPHQISSKDLKKIIYKKASNTASPGPNGEQFRHVQIFTNADPKCLEALKLLVNDQLANRNIPNYLRELIIVTLGFGTSKPNGDTRPTGLPQTLDKITGTCATYIEKKNIKAHNESSTTPTENPYGKTQYGVNSPNGCLLAAKAIQSTLRADPNNAAAKFDAINAYNTTDRTQTKKGYCQTEVLQPNIPYYNFKNANKSTILVPNPNFPNNVAELDCTVGSRQGEVRGAHDYAIAKKLAVKILKQEFPNLTIVSIIDDLGVAGNHKELVYASIRWTELLEKYLGTSSNIPKNTFVCPNDISEDQLFHYGLPP